MTSLLAQYKRLVLSTETFFNAEKIKFIYTIQSKFGFSVINKQKSIFYLKNLCFYASNYGVH